MKEYRSLMERAKEYVAQLVEGAELVDDTDGPFIEPFRHLLSPLLFVRGLYLEATARGQRVTSTAPWLVRRLDSPGIAPVWCCRCSRSLFDPECIHGIRYVIDLGEPDWPAWVPPVARGALVVQSVAQA